MYDGHAFSVTRVHAIVLNPQDEFYYTSRANSDLGKHYYLLRYNVYRICARLAQLCG